MKMNVRQQLIGCFVGQMLLSSPVSFAQKVMLKTKNKENTFNACPVEAGNALRLREPMPVMDQLNSPWCATFTAAYQLKHYARQNGVKLPLNLNLSVLDLNQKTDDSEHGIPGHFMITNGAKIDSVLSGVQKNNFRIKTEKSQPFVLGDEALVGKAYQNWLSQLENKLRDKNTGDIASILVEQSGSGYQIKGKLHGKKNSEGMVISGLEPQALQTSFSQNYPESYPDEIQVPPFRWSRESFQTRDPKGQKEFADALASQLRNQTPIGISICGSQLKKDWMESSGIPLDSAFKRVLKNDPCGEHGITVIGMRKNEEGRCLVELQNSWGESWNGDGRIEVPIERLASYDLLKKKDAGTVKIVTIQKDARGSNANEMKNFDGTHYLGQVANNKFEGQGRLTESNGGIFEGTFVNGNPVSGRAQGIIYSVQDPQTKKISIRRFTGEVISGSPDPRSEVRDYLMQGNGRLEDDSGFYQEGLFEKNRFINGRTKTTTSDGNVFEGTQVNNRFQDGIMILKDGRRVKFIKGESYLIKNND